MHTESSCLALRLYLSRALGSAPTSKERPSAVIQVVFKGAPIYLAGGDSGVTYVPCFLVPTSESNGRCPPCSATSSRSLILENIVP
jgi:hypothetical protein